MKCAVIYRSKTGFTEKYARWIAEELASEVFECSKASRDLLKKYDAVVYGGSVHASGILGIGLIKKNLDILKGKRVAVFAVGAASPDEKIVKEIRDKNFSSDELKKIEFFYLRGGFNFNKLGFADKAIMRVFKKIIEKKKEKTEEEIGMLAAYNKPADFTKKENVKGIVEYIKAKD